MELAPVVPVGGAGAPPNATESNAKEPLVGMITFASKNEERLRGLFEKVEGLEGVGEFRPLGGLSDPSVTYLGRIDESLRETIEIIFYTLDAKEVGIVKFYFKSKEPELYLKSIDTSEGEIGKGYGKRMLSAVMDFARRAGSAKVSLDSFPSSVSFYLGVNSPFAFNEPANEIKYKKRYRKLIHRGINNKTAKRTAGNAFQNGNDGVFHIVPMSAKMRKSRRANRKRGTRRRRT